MKAAGSAPPRRPYAILVADDNVVIQKVVKFMLERCGHRVTVVHDGRQALAARNQATFDLVLMDVQMPKMDGFEAVAAIRREEESTGAHLPIIAVTARTGDGFGERCLGAGFDAYVSKPVCPEVLLTTIEQLLASSPK
jgi:CheY-like chemotaxis protein